MILRVLLEGKFNKEEIFFTIKFNEKRNSLNVYYIYQGPIY